jgi:serine/threonine-protein kinase HipA
MTVMTPDTPYAIVFAGLSRQGPGSVRSTRKALSLLPPLAADGDILDLGCGTGASALVVAAALGRPVVAGDVNPASLEVVRRRARAAGLAIDTVAASLDATGRPPASAALIWSEGAVFTVGVAAALRHWHPILKPGGVVAFTELCWTGPDRPADAVDFFAACYPPMTDIGGLIGIATGCGYRLEAAFVLPDADWWDEYYAELAPALDRHRDHPDPAVRAVIATCDRELDIGRRFGASYGYAFVILTKVG